MCSILTRTDYAGRFRGPLFIFIIIAIFSSSCGEKLTPSETVEAYFKAVKKKDIKQVSRYILDGDKYYNAYQEMSDIAKRQSLRQLSKNLYERIEITEEKILGDSAKVNMKFIGADYGKRGIFQMKLRKVGGRWKIVLGSRQ